MESAELASWAAAHEAQIDAALERVRRSDDAHSGLREGAWVSEAVQLRGTACHFVLYRRRGVPPDSAYGVWCCSSAAEAAAVVAKGGHEGFPTRSDSVFRFGRVEARNHALLLAVKARKKGKRADGAGDGEGPVQPGGDAAAAHGAAPALAGDDVPRDDAARRDDEASPPAKKLRTPAAVGTTSGMFSGSAPPGGLILAPATVAPTTELVPAAPRSDAARVAELEAELAKARNELRRVTHRCNALEAADAARQEAFEAMGPLRAAAAAAAAAGAALVATANGVTAALDAAAQ